MKVRVLLCVGCQDGGGQISRARFVTNDELRQMRLVGLRKNDLRALCEGLADASQLPFLAEQDSSARGRCDLQQQQAELIQSISGLRIYSVGDVAVQRPAVNSSSVDGSSKYLLETPVGGRICSWVQFGR